VYVVSTQKIEILVDSPTSLPLHALADPTGSEFSPWWTDQTAG
jgi:hypothetical protein